MTTRFLLSLPGGKTVKADLKNMRKRWSDHNYYVLDSQLADGTVGVRADELPKGWGARPLDTDIRQNIWDALDATGIRWRRGQTETGHLIILPSSNLKPWTPAEQQTLENSVRGLPATQPHYIYEITDRLVRPNWIDYKPDPGRGFRIYTTPTTQTDNTQKP